MPSTLRMGRIAIVGLLNFVVRHLGNGRQAHARLAQVLVVVGRRRHRQGHRDFFRDADAQPAQNRRQDNDEEDQVREHQHGMRHLVAHPFDAVQQLVHERALSGFRRNTCGHSLLHESGQVIRTPQPVQSTTGSAAGRPRDGCACCSARLRGPELRQLDAHLGRGRHVLQADPFQRPVDLLHAGEHVGRRHAQLGQPRAVGAAADRHGERLDARLPARLARQLDRPHVVLQPVAHVAVLRRDGAGDVRPRLARLDRRADLARAARPGPPAPRARSRAG